MKTIPLQGAAAASSACDEPSGEPRRLDLPLARREFLKGSGILIGSIAAGSVLAALAPSPVWAVELQVLSQAEGEALMKMSRTLYPHKKLPDAVYALLAKDLDAMATADAGTAQQLREGIEGLAKATSSGRFARASDAKRLVP